MKYINERILFELGVDWLAMLSLIADVTELVKKKDICQPLKPYLRFKNPANRIIAMPAYVGGSIDSVGIKWIASFPKNSNRSLNRAHSVIVLNDSDTGVPNLLINSSALSAIRTASISGFILSKYLAVNDIGRLSVGILGFGPIGKFHLRMIRACFGHRLAMIRLYDIKPIDAFEAQQVCPGLQIEICSSWQDVFDHSNVLITCTVAKDRYIDREPKKGAIYLNVSLRDFTTNFLKLIDVIAVDDWEEINRENTDIEKAVLANRLNKKDVLEMADLLDEANFINLSHRSFMFNPMGMAVYDISIARYYRELALKCNNIIELED